MKKISVRLSLLAAALLGIGSLFTHATTLYIGTELQGWDNMSFLSQTFWNANPTSGDITQSIFGTSQTGTTAYTKNRSGYAGGDCDIANMTVNYVNPGSFGSSSDPITGGQIFILESGDYNVNPTMTLSGSCIGVIGSGNVTMNGFVRDTTNAKNIIIDNIQEPQITITNKAYTNTGNEEIGITLTNVGASVSGTIIGNIQSSITGDLLDNTTNTGSIKLSAGDGPKNIDISIESGNIFLNHFNKQIILDTKNPLFTGTTQTNKTVTSGGFYNTGVSFTFSDINLSGATINGNPYIEGEIISTEGQYTFVVNDKAGNSTGIVFEIDYTVPTFVGTTQGGATVVSGNIYNTGISFVLSDTNLSGATINGNPYASGSILSGEGAYIFIVSDKAGNSTGLRFSIDTTAPTCSTYSPISGSVLSSAAINFTWNCSDNFAGISGQTLVINDSGNHLIYSTGFTETGTAFTYYGESNIYNWNIVATDKAGNQSTMPIQTITYKKPIIITLRNSGVLYQSKYYVNNANVNFAFTGNMSFVYQFTGDILASNSYMYVNGTTNRSITLSGADGIKNVIINYSTATQSGVIGPKAFYLDRVSPTVTGTFPTPLLKTKQTTINFTRTATDSGAGISNYILEFGSIASGTSIVYTGTSTNYNISNLADGIYQWKVTAVDYAGNTKSTSLTQLTIDTTIPTVSGVTGNAYYSGDVTPMFVGTGTLTIGSASSKPFTGGTTITGEGTYKLVVTNEVNNSTTVNFTIDKTNPQILMINPGEGTNITASNSVVFLRNGADANLSGYVFNLNGPTTTSATTAANTITVPNLSNGNYTWDVKVIDKAGNETQGTGQHFTLNLTLSGSFSLSGMVGTSGSIYTNTTFGIQVLTNKSANITIGGNLLGSMISSGVTAGINQTILVTPTIGDGLKTFTILANTGVESFSGSVSGYLDTTAPSVPSFNGQATSYSGAFTIGWTASTDAGVGMGDYIYSISNGTATVKSGSTINNSINVANVEIGGTGTYTLYVASRDRLGNTSTSGSFAFTYTGLVDIIPDSFSLNRIYDADLDTKITSDKITVSGLSAGALVLSYVDTGSLIINGSNIGMTGYVQNGDKVQIAIYSSEDYDTITSGILTIGNQSSTFKITTIADDSNGNDSYSINSLTTTQKLHISLIYNTLSELYAGTKQEDFMLSLKALVQDKIDQMESDDEDAASIDTMKYLHNLINNDFAGDSSSSSSSDTYTAPNGKDYKISHDTDGYTSSNFIKTKYFDTRDEIESYIDKNNPKSVYVGGDYSIDESRTSSTYKAPNGKVYNFFKTTTGKYGSSNFASVKLFDDVTTMKKHIDTNNPKK